MDAPRKKSVFKYFSSEFGILIFINKDVCLFHLQVLNNIFNCIRFHKDTYRKFNQLYYLTELHSRKCKWDVNLLLSVPWRYGQIFALNWEHNKEGCNWAIQIHKTTCSYNPFLFQVISAVLIKIIFIHTTKMFETNHHHW